MWMTKSRGAGGVREAHLDGELAGGLDVKVWVNRRHRKSDIPIQEGALEGRGAQAVWRGV